jgi:hypothetical protein
MEPSDGWEDDEGGRWRTRLEHWRAPEAPPRLERALREEFRRRQGRSRGRAHELWAGRAAVAALVVAASLLVRAGRPVGPPVLPVSAGAEVYTALDLSGFEPVLHPRLLRPLPAMTEVDLDGFEPVRTMRVTRLKGGRP